MARLLQSGCDATTASLHLYRCNEEYGTPQKNQTAYSSTLASEHESYDRCVEESPLTQFRRRYSLPAEGPRHRSAPFAERAQPEKARRIPDTPHELLMTPPQRSLQQASKQQLAPGTASSSRGLDSGHKGLNDRVAPQIVASCARPLFSSAMRGVGEASKHRTRRSDVSETLLEHQKLPSERQSVTTRAKPRHYRSSLPARMQELPQVQILTYGELPAKLLLDAKPGLPMPWRMPINLDSPVKQHRMVTRHSVSEVQVRCGSYDSSHNVQPAPKKAAVWTRCGHLNWTKTGSFAMEGSPRDADAVSEEPFVPSTREGKVVVPSDAADATDQENINPRYGAEMRVGIRGSDIAAKKRESEPHKPRLNEGRSSLVEVPANLQRKSKHRSSLPARIEEVQEPPILQYTDLPRQLLLDTAVGAPWSWRLPINVESPEKTMPVDNTQRSRGRG